MGLAVRHVHCSIACNEGSVRAGQLACARVAVGSIAALPVAKHGANRPVPIDTANHVILRIGNIDGSIRRAGYSLRTIESRLLRRTAVAGVPLFSGPAKMENAARPLVDAVHRVPLAKHDAKISVPTPA